MIHKSRKKIKLNRFSFYILPYCVEMPAALIIALVIESHICDKKSFFSNTILEKVIHLLIVFNDHNKSRK